MEEAPTLTRGDAGPLLGKFQAEVRDVVLGYCEEPSHRAMMLRALARPGFALCEEGPCRAGALTSSVFQAIRREPSAEGFRAAGAVELYMSAAYMFDNVADQDEAADLDISYAEEQALAISALSCGNALALEAVHGAGRDRAALSILTRLQRQIVSSSAGQFLDAHMERADSATTRESLRMTSLKAGSLGRLAAGFGAWLATDDAGTIDTCEEFGSNLFTFMQLIDDIRDAKPENSSDIRRNKKTIPIVFLHHQMAQARDGLPDGILPPPGSIGTGAPQLDELDTSGADAFGVIVAEAFLNRAKGALANLAGHDGGGG